MLIAWDTTDRVNWGARGAHIAARQLLSTNADDVELLPGVHQLRKVPVEFAFPEWIARRLRHRQDRFWPAQVYVELERLFGAKMDFLDVDPESSLQNILNNTQNDHIRQIHDAVRRHERIVVDGNGDMIFKDEPRRTLLADLALVELGHYFDKEVYYVNSIFADCPITGRNEVLAARCLETLEKCDAVAFRDPESLRQYREMSGRTDAHLIPDSLFYWYRELHHSRKSLPDNGDFLIPFLQESRRHFGKLDFGSPYICVTGGSRAAFTPRKAFQGFCELVTTLHELGHPVYLVPTCGGDRFLHDVAEETGTPIVPAEVPILMGGAILANAHLFVTGRYHPSIMAAAGGTPCVFLGADSHKTRSLQRMLGYDDPHVFSAIPTPDEHDDLLARGRDLLDGGQPVRDRIQQEAQKRAEETKELATLVNGDAPSR